MVVAQVLAQTQKKIAIGPYIQQMNMKDAVQPETVNYKKIEHFMNIEVKQDEAVLHVIDIDGNEFDTIKVKRRETN